MALGVAREHPVEIGREQGCLLPALASADLDDDVLLVEWIARHELAAQLRQRLFELARCRGEVLARDVAQVAVVGVDELPRFLQALLGVAQRADRFDDGRQLRELLPHLADALVAAGDLRIGHEPRELVVTRLHLREAPTQSGGERIAHAWRDVDHLRLRPTRRDPLQQQPRRDEQLHQRIGLVRCTEAQHLVRDRGYRHDERQASQEIHEDVRSRQEREQGDRDHDDEQQERRPAAGMRGRVGLDLGAYELIAVLERMDRHVLGAVVHEHATDVGHERDGGEISEEQDHPQHALGDVQKERRLDELTRCLGREIRDPDEERERGDERDAEDHGIAPAAHRTLALLELHVGGLHEHPRAVGERFPEDDEAAHERRAGETRPQQK